MSLGDEARRKLDDLPEPDLPVLEVPCDGKWNSVALFFNLDMPSSDLPAGYAATNSDDALEWLDEGDDPLDPGISEFLCRYWGALSYGKLAFGLNTPRDSAGKPIVPSIAPPGGNPKAWDRLIKAFIDAHAEAIWKAGGSLMRGGKRWIPSVVLMQNYDVNASAFYGGYDRTVGGHTYEIGDRTHLRLKFNKTSLPGSSVVTGRGGWGTLCHEYAHRICARGHPALAGWGMALSSMFLAC